MVNEIVCNFAIDARLHEEFQWNQLPLQILELNKISIVST